MRPPGSVVREKRPRTRPASPEARSAHAQPARVGERPGGGLHRDCFRLGHAVAAVRVDDGGALVDEHRRDVDADRADLEAGAAERRGVRQGRGLLVGDAVEERVEDRADRAGVDRAVGVAADPLVDRAHVEARRAADAAQRLPADVVGERAGAAVVEQDDVHLLRAVAGRHARPGRGVGVHPLPRRRARQQPQHRVEVGPGGDDLLDADDADQHVGQGQAHPPVALGLHDDERAGVGDGEVGAADRDLRAQELLAQVLARRPRQHGRLVGEVVGRRLARRRPSGGGRSRGPRPGCGGSPAPGCARAGRRRAGR